MANKTVDVTTGEVKESLEEVLCEEAPRVRIIHCKPVYNYQSVEFDWELYEDSFGDFDIGAMEKFYSEMLQMLIRVSQIAPQSEAKKPVAPVEELASEKQKEILRNFHVDFKEPLTKKQAHALIKKSMDQEIF